MLLTYALVGTKDGQTLTIVFTDGEVLPIPSSHPNFQTVLDYVVSDSGTDEDQIKSLLDVVQSVALKLTALSERVSVGGNTLYFDDEPLDDALGNHILRLVREGDEKAWKPFVAFLEKLATNPSVESQKSLYSWIADRNLTIAENGDFIAYKGVTSDSKSIHSGEAFVDGVLHKGQIPNEDGAVVSMPRGNVDSNVGEGCSTGLHAGTWDYASGFARGRVLEVRINPRDVVSVPSDSAHQKLRVCRYTVVKSIEQAYEESTIYEEDDEDYDPFEEEEEDIFGFEDDENEPEVEEELYVRDAFGRFARRS